MAFISPISVSRNNPLTVATATRTTTTATSTPPTPFPQVSPEPLIVSPYWKGQWYPVAVSAFTDKTKPNAFTLLGNPIVLWWDGVWRCVDDTCPHRLAPLSEGRIDEDGRIECPYHGWAMRGNDGQVMSIPQLEDPADLPKFSRTCKVNAYHVVEAQGLIWVYATPMSALQVLLLVFLLFPGEFVLFVRNSPLITYPR